MAKAITHIEPSASTWQAEQTPELHQLMAALGGRQEALVQLLDIVQELQDAGILDILSALLKRRHEVGAIAIGQLNSTSTHRLIKNGMNALQFLGKLDPGALETLLESVAAGVKNAAEKSGPDDNLGLWRLGKSAFEPEVKTSIQILIRFLQGMGRAANENL